MAVDPTNANIVYAGGTANGGTPGLAESTDGGNTWAAIAGSTHTDIHALTFDGNGKLLNGNDGGIYRLAFSSGNSANTSTAERGHPRRSEVGNRNQHQDN